MTLSIDGQNLSFRSLADFVFRRKGPNSVQVPLAAVEKVKASQTKFMSLIEKKIPIYGVTTGFGDSCFRSISAQQSPELQANLVSYLLCGTGPVLSPETSRAVLAIRLNSLVRGYSGVSPALIERMRFYLEKDWIAVIPREGSLGASGDLIPLAYIAQTLQGRGKVFKNGQPVAIQNLLLEEGLPAYELQPKEGLALVNGTSAMAGLYLVNLTQARFLVETICVATSWLCLALQGRTEAFNQTVNEFSKNSPGQKNMAERVRTLLNDEKYAAKPLDQIQIQDLQTQDFVQDRYSLRCVPQILGPIWETLELLERWLNDEINGTSDNPLVGEDGQLSMGGNFYGGYLSHGMDYLKISLAHMADLMDRQLMTIIDEKSNRGLPANLADWPNIPKDQQHLHHGLKGLHQSASAITSEVMARAIPGGIFSRSSESHNQDKVSLGMSAAVQCSEMLEPLFTIATLHLVVLAQALDLRGVKLQGELGQSIYTLVRSSVPRVSRDQALDDNINDLRQKLKDRAFKQGNWFGDSK